MKTPALALAMFLFNVMAIGAQVTQIVAKPLTEDDIRLIRQDIQSVKDEIITHTMQFSAAEAAVFWPVYHDYAAEQHAIAERRFAVIVEYAKNIDSLTDSQASNLTQRLLQAEDEAQTLRRKYFPSFQTVIGAKRAAKFYQVDNRLTMIQNVQLASEVPLIP